MTEQRMNQDLSLKEEYGRTGHVGPEMNGNAETYQEPTPAISAPGGKAAAGYTNCHAEVYPFSFNILGVDVCDAVLRLLDALLVNDVPELMLPRQGNPKYGKLRRLLTTCAARLIGSYNDLVNTPGVGVENKIVMKILMAAKTAAIDDESVPTHPGRRWHIVLKAWSKRIKDDFVGTNPDQVQVGSGTDASMANLVESLGKRIETLTSKVDSSGEDKAIIATMREEQLLSSLENQRLRKRLDAKKRENRQLQLQLGQLQGQLQARWEEHDSPSGTPVRTPQRSRSLEPPSREAETTMQTDSPTVDVQEPTAKKPRTSKLTTNKSASASKGELIELDGVGEVTPKSLGGILVADELERLWKEGICKKKKEASCSGVVSKSALHYRNHDLFVGLNPAFNRLSQGKAYSDAMKLVAMAISDGDWQAMLDGMLDGPGSRKLFLSIQNDAMLRVLELEIETGIKTAGSTSNAKPSLHSLACRMRKVWRTFENGGMSELDIQNKVATETGGLAIGTQSTLTSYLGNAK